MSCVQVSRRGCLSRQVTVQRTACLLRAGPGSGQGLGMEGLDPSTIPGPDSASPSFAAGRLWRAPDSAERLLSVPLRIAAFIPAALLPGSPAERKCPRSRAVTIALSGPCVAKPQPCLGQPWAKAWAWTASPRVTFLTLHSPGTGTLGSCILRTLWGPREEVRSEAWGR